MSLDAAAFKLPIPLPSWPPGGDFAKGVLDLGGLEVIQISTFTKVWSTPQGGPCHQGATFYKPSPLPCGFSLLGHYAQSNSKKRLSGWVFAARDISTTKILARPLDYTLLYSGSSPIAGHGFFWFPVAPYGYRPAGVLVTTSAVKPSLDEVRCIRTDFAGECENDAWIWGNDSGIDAYKLRPRDRGIHVTHLSVGSFIIGTPPCTAPPMASLNNKCFGNFNIMPNLDQIMALLRVYAPVFYFHPDDFYLPSSVNWYFEKGALLYKKDDPRPSLIKPEGANLPQGGSTDGTFWLDLPTDGTMRDAILKGDVGSTMAYVHVKPMLGGTFTDLAMWLFYPFNGAARAKLGAIKTISLGKIGEHVGDWEHVTLRVSNLTGELWRVYMSQHNCGTWYELSELELEPGTNQPVAYSSLNGHANYAHPGLNLQGKEKLRVGLRNDTAKGGARLDTAQNFEVVAVEHLEGVLASPPWVNYLKEWGPKVPNHTGKELNKVLKFIPEPFNSEIRKIVEALPQEVLGQHGPTGPKGKSSWAGDET